MVPSAPADWLANVRSVVAILGAFGAVLFGAVGAVAKLGDENVQIWTLPPAKRQKLMWRVRARYRVVFRRLYYSSFHELFYRALDDSGALLRRNFLKPSPVFSQPDQANVPLFALPIVIFLTWIYYLIFNSLLSRPEMVIPQSLEELSSGAGALIHYDLKGGLSGRVVALIALPMFTLLPIGFSMWWGVSVVHIWHRLMLRLPPRIWQRYAPFSSIPRLLILSFALTSLALTVGKFTSPLAPMPTSTRVFVVNTLFDVASVGTAWLFLRRAITPPGRKDRPAKRFFPALAASSRSS